MLNFNALFLMKVVAKATKNSLRITKECLNLPNQQIFVLVQKFLPF